MVANVTRQSSPPLPDADSASVRRARTGYLEMFDSLRGIGMFLVLIGHLGIASKIRANPVPGSWLGVSMFFTMSGFLICRQVLTGAASERGFDLRDFWRRRANRLFPAAFVCIALVMLCTSFGWITAGPGFRHEIVATVFYANNWYRARVLTNGGAFSQFWSLAVEEQFYVFFPLLFLLFRRFFGNRGAQIFGALTIVGFAVTGYVAHHQAIIFTYIATHTRVAEILAGVTFAYVVVSASYLRLLEERWFRTATQVAGIVGLATYAVLWTRVTQYQPSSYLWPLWANVLASLALIMCGTVDGPVTRRLSIRPLRWLGRISYGTYVFHALIYLLLTSHRLGISNDLQLAVIRITTAIGVAWLSNRFVEQPFRRLRTTRYLRLTAGWSVAALLIVAGAFFLPFVESTPTYPRTKIGAGGFATIDAQATDDSFRLVVLGDQLATASLPGLHEIVDPTPGMYWVSAHTSTDCPLGGVATIALGGTPTPSDEECRTLHFFAGGATRGDAAHQYIVQGGIANLADRLMSDGGWQHVGQREFDKLERKRLDALAAQISQLPTERVDWYLLDPDDAIAAFRAAEKRAAANPSDEPIVAPRPPATTTPRRPGSSTTRGSTTTTSTTTPPRVEVQPAPASPSDAELRRRVAAFNDLVEQASRSHSKIHLHSYEGPLGSSDWHKLLPSQ